MSQIEYILNVLPLKDGSLSLILELMMVLRGRVFSSLRDSV